MFLNDIQGLTSAEVSLLPGCGTKIAELWHCWKETGQLAEIREAESDTMMATLRVFYKIWGVGDVTARELYRKGWCSAELMF